MKLASLTLAFIAAAAGAQSALTLAVDTLKIEDGRAQAVVRITNGAAHAYRAVLISCAFLHNGKAVATSDDLVENLPAGEAGFVTLRAKAPTADQARCRITATTP